MRLKFIFFKVVQTVIAETVSIILSSTIFPPKALQSSVFCPREHQSTPVPANEPRIPLQIESLSVGWRIFLRSIAAKRPSSTNRFFTPSRLRGVAPRASATLMTIHLGPYSPASSNRRALAYNIVRAALFPVVEKNL